MFNDGKYSLQPTTKIVADKSLPIINQLSTPANSSVMIGSNHLSSVVLIEEAGKNTFDDSYEEMKIFLRKQFPGKPVFAVFNNCEMTLKPIDSGEGEFVTRWLVLNQGTSSFFYGDRYNDKSIIDTLKYNKMLVFSCGNPSGGLIEVVLIIDELSEREDIRAAIRRQTFPLFKVKGMRGSYPTGSSVTDFIIATDFEVVFEKFTDYRNSLAKLNSFVDLMPWRNYHNGERVPDFMETAILLSTVFYSRYGHAAFNLLLIGAPGSGKSFFGEAVCHLCDWKITECGESTAKGLIMSHAKNARGKGESDKGKPGVLYTAPFIVALNEFCRIISSTRSAGTEDYNKILSHMNGVVERKLRGKVSGIVDHNNHVMKASMISFDNDYGHQLDPFLDAMVEDASYQRRYSILKPSKQTEEKGKKAAAVQDVSLAEIEFYYMRQHSMDKEEWYGIARYLRWEMSRAAKMVPQEQYDEMFAYVEKVKNKYLDKLMGNPAILDPAAKELRRMMGDANFGQLATACLISSFVLLNVDQVIKEHKSRPGKSEVRDPLLGRKGLSKGQFEFAKRMIERLLGDFYFYIGPAIERRVSRPLLKRY